MKFDLDDIILVPTIISSINSRSEVNIYDDMGMLPIMTAPMDTVVDNVNWKEFAKNKIHSVLPRKANSTEYSKIPFRWFSYGIEEFEQLFIHTDKEFDRPVYALIDIANGHMQRLVDAIKQSKDNHGKNLVLMVGNIANPRTYFYLAEAGADYVRLGIGNGSACTTSANVAIGYPIGSLIKECADIKEASQLKCKIVADGGFKNYSDINKALALGADYVMLGGMLNKCWEASGPVYTKNSFTHIYEEYNVRERARNYEGGIDEGDCDPKHLMIFHTFYKKYRGMSTKAVQKDWGKTTLRTSEGIEKYNEVEYTLEGFVNNLEDYMKSAMSYLGAKTLHELKNSRYELITPAAFKRFNK